MASGFDEAPLRREGLTGAKAASGNEGHRDRLRRRYVGAGAAALAHHELLELLLFEFVPRADTKELAKALLARFGNLEGVLFAPAKELQTVKGVGARIANAISTLADIQRRAMEDRLRDRDVLDNWKAVIEYLRGEMGFLHREQFRVLFLNKRNVLIANEAMQEGTVDHAPAYPREVIRRAIELSATAVILVHNHPSGDPTPSRADIEMTQRIIESGKPLEIVVHDHIVMGRDGHASLRGLQLI